MSTKIYTGFRIETPFSSVISVLRNAAPQIRSLAQDNARETMMEMLFDLYVDLVVRGEAPETAIKNLYHDQTWEAQAQYITRRFTHREDPDEYSSLLLALHGGARSFAEANESEIAHTRSLPNINMLMGVTVFPYGRGTVGIAWGDPKLVDAFLARSEILDFSYWNNTERPDNVTTAEWRKRKRAWDKLIPGCIPADYGFGYRLSDVSKTLFPYLVAADFNKWWTDRRMDLSERVAIMKEYKRLVDYKKINAGSVSSFLALHDEAVRTVRANSQMVIDAEKELPADLRELIRIINEYLPEKEEN